MRAPPTLPRKCSAQEKRDRRPNNHDTSYGRSDHGKSEQQYESNSSQHSEHQKSEDDADWARPGDMDEGDLAGGVGHPASGLGRPVRTGRDDLRLAARRIGRLSRLLSHDANLVKLTGLMWDCGTAS